MPGTKLGTTTFTPEQLAKTFVTYRQELLQTVFFSMQKLLKHTSMRTGIRYKEVVSSMYGDFQVGNFDKDKYGTKGVDIRAREFETFLGNCVEEIDIVSITQSIWGANVTTGQKSTNVPFVLQVAAYIVKRMWENVLLNTFTAKHDGSDKTSTAKFFNGFKTIVDNDIAGTGPSAEVLISKDLGNLSTSTESITKDNAEQLIKDFFWSRDEKLRGQECKLFISDQTYHFYTEDYQTSHGSLPYNQAYDKKTLEGATNVEFVPLSFVPNDFMLLTPKNNIFCLFNQGPDDSYDIRESKKNYYDLAVIANMFFGDF